MDERQVWPAAPHSGAALFSRSDGADDTASEAASDGQGLSEDGAEEAPLPGALLESTGPVVMRSEASFASCFVERLQPEEAVLVRECGGEPPGSRLHVQLLSSGIKGWVSSVASNGTQLWSRLPAHDGRQRQARLLYDPYARMYVVPEDFLVEEEHFDPKGLWLEALRDTWLLERPTVNGSRKLPLQAGSLVQILGVGEQGRRVRVRTTGELEGWVTVVYSGRLPMWRLLADGAGEGIRICPYTAERWEALRQIEREAFGEGEERLRGWVASSKRSPATFFLDVAKDGHARVVGYCAWRLARDDDRCSSDCLQILSIAVHSEYRGQRIGQKLIEWAWKRGRSRFPDAKLQSLHVRSDNASAIRLYDRCGFAVLCQIASFYGDEDALYMVRSLGSG